jgi:hypothetical protein
MAQAIGIRRTYAAAFIATTAILGPSLFAVAATGAPSGTTLVGASLTADTTSLTGTQLARLTVTLHLTDAGGVEPQSVTIEPGATATCPCALLDGDNPFDMSDSDQGMNVRAAPLSLVSGTPQDGMWAGSTTVGSPGHGHWQLAGLIAGTLRHPEGETPTWYAVDGATYEPGVDITGTHRPLLTMSTPKLPVPWPNRYVLIGGAAYSDTGAPIAGLQLSVLLVWDGSWPLPTSDLVTVTTDSDGRWSLTTGSAGVASLVAYATEPVSATEPSAGVQFTSGFQAGACCRWNPMLSVTRAGTARYLDVHYGRGAKARLQLQRRTSSGWQILVSRTGPASGSFRFTTHTAGVYRVRASDPPGIAYPFLRTHTSPAIRV